MRPFARESADLPCPRSHCWPGSCSSLMMNGAFTLEGEWFPCSFFRKSGKFRCTLASDWMHQFWIVRFSDRPEAKSGLASLGVVRLVWCSGGFRLVHLPFLRLLSSQHYSIGYMLLIYLLTEQQRFLVLGSLPTLH